jgi:hypothetical protein
MLSAVSVMVRRRLFGLAITWQYSSVELAVSSLAHKSDQNVKNNL